MRLFLYIALLFCVLGTFNNLQATHIVGGQITYTHVDSTTYRIRCEVLRDCQNGAPDVYFDDPAHFGVFNQSNFLIDDLAVDFSGIDDTLTNGVVGDVCVYSEAVCIHRTVYEFDVTLPETGTYTIAYQRCCRSEVLSNLIDPLSTGLTFMVQIDAELENNSAQFGTEFPTVVYTNTAFIFDGSGTDTDGDSLVYELNTPFQGGTFNVPQPIPAFPPPYDTVVYAPGYSLDNMLGGDYPLVINPTTGELSAIPTLSGLFQISYRIKEYRDGEYISTVFREFVFNVVPPNNELTLAISGQVFAEEGEVLDAGYVELQDRNVSTDLFSVLETDFIESPADAGQYLFDTIYPGVNYLQAFPDPASTYFDSHLPTYLGGTLLWYEAEPINQCDTSQENRDIQLIPTADPEGDQTVILTVFAADNGIDPISGLKLFLFNGNGQPVYGGETDENGQIIFEDLLPEIYEVKIDSINSPYLNETAALLDVSQGTNFTSILDESSLNIIGVTFDLNGQVRIDEETPLDQGIVELYAFNAQTNTYLALDNDEISSDADGEYNFESVVPAPIFLKAIPATASPYANTYLPTYFGGALLWYEATELDPLENTPDGRDITLTQLVDAGGDQDVVLTIFDEEDGETPISGLKLYLFNEAGEPVSSSATNELGQIIFENLTASTYSIKIDSLNSLYLNESDVLMDVGLGTNFIGLLDDTSLELSVISSTAELGPQLSKNLALSPNPSNGLFNLRLVDGSIMKSVSIFTANGQLVFERNGLGKSSSARINLSEMNSGVYFVRATDKNNRSYTNRIILK